MIKSASYTTRYIAPTRNPKTTVYSKADRTSKILGIIEGEGKEIAVDFSTPGLKGDGPYWSIFHFEKGEPFMIGFVPDEDFKFG